MKAAHIGIAAITLLICTAVAHADELNKTKIAEWNDPLTPPQSRSDCVDHWSMPAIGTSGCKAWVLRWRHMENEVFVVTNGPADLGADAKNAATQCAVVAGAAAAAAGYASGGTAAVTAAKAAFSACMSAKAQDVGDKYDIQITQASGWSDYH